ncbi:uncharacterized protein LOC129762257 [Toxorhynchites rutilus septentrionalis]|uniref:uncharacterized protein LOC129762257 n=1 Tax=Toxorhynchites rutilus septentrionalis TaxID=329112 RepID=UPI002478FFC8|nr:uncharacterized protein LOC129762257 [Toxorhynchites rutilus septentrionalis]
MQEEDKLSEITMNPNDILQQYLELFTSDTSQLLYVLASNAVLDWNGITVRGRTKIVKFLRRKQQEGTIQMFSDATMVEAFEERDTHIGTKTTPPENLAQCLDSEQMHESQKPLLASPSTSTSSKDLSYETPPRTLPALPHPPPLTRGCEFLSSDDEEDVSQAGCRVSKNSPPPDKPSSNNYTELQYLAAIGILRTATESKHHSTRFSNHIPREDHTVESSSSGVSITPTSARLRDQTEKRAKLKISYRIHRLSREVQFALLIYEHFPTRSSTVRRNLFSDAGETQNLNDIDEESVSSISPQQTNDDSLVGQPLPESSPPPPPPPASLELPAVQRLTPQLPLTPPGTPLKRRRCIPPQRSRPVNEFIVISESGGGGGGGTSSASSTGHSSRKNNNTQQSCKRKSSQVQESLSAKKNNFIPTTCKRLRF